MFQYISPLWLFSQKSDCSVCTFAVPFLLPFMFDKYILHDFTYTKLLQGFLTEQKERPLSDHKKKQIVDATAFINRLLVES